MFAKPVITVPVVVLQTNADNASTAPARMAGAFEREAVRYLRPLFISIIAPPRGAHKRPTDWQSDKQRRWWFAVGIHQWSGRTGRQEASWRTDTRTSEAGGIMRYWSTNPASVFIQGYQQQQMHFGTWKREDDAVAEFQPLAIARIQETWLTISSPTAGVRR